MGKYLMIIMLLTAGCTEAIGDLKRVTYDDALAYIIENHAVRVQYRMEKELVLAEQRAAYRNAATTAAVEGRLDDAEALWGKVLELLERHYRDLATVEALQAGVSEFGEFRRETLSD